MYNKLKATNFWRKINTKVLTPRKIKAEDQFYLRLIETFK